MKTHPEFPGLSAYDDTDANFDPDTHHGHRVVVREEDGEWLIRYVEGAADADEALAFGLNLAQDDGHAVQSYGVNDWPSKGI